MQWYYAAGEERLGPVLQEEFDAMVQEGTISTGTLVWREGMADWLPYEKTRAQGSPTELEGGSVSLSGAVATCAECGNVFGSDEMIQYGEAWICAQCKPIYFQRIREGADLPGAVKYGGFWIRFAAKFVDGLVLGTFQIMVQTVSLLSASEELFVIFFAIALLINYTVPIVYSTLFVGAYGATPGKMVCGLKILRADGAKVTYLRALGRYFAELLSSLIFMIGYVMAAFDEEKRTLHDRICDTRVVLSRA